MEELRIVAISQSTRLNLVNYSALKAVMGSDFVALRAGI